MTLAAVVCMAGGCAAGQETAKSTSTGTPPLGAQVFAVSARQALPAIRGKTLAGMPISLRSLLGHSVLVVNVWASWCANCRDESAALAKAASAAGPSTARFVGIDEQDSTAAARTYVAAVGMRYPQLVDSTGEVLNKLSLLPRSGIPSTLLVDRHGKMAARIVGPLTGLQLEKLVTELSAER